jgi:hypothetical protein
MKAVLILIVSVGASQANLDLGGNSLEVRQIEFSNVVACERAAEKLSRAGRSGSDWAKTFAVDTARVTGNGPYLALPSVIAECVEF